MQAGDTLNRIAATYAIGLDDLARANNLFDYNRILIGQALIIPAPVTPAGVPQVIFAPSQTALPARSDTPAPTASATPPLQALNIAAPPTAGGVLSMPALPSATATPSAPSVISVNDIPLASIVVMPQAVRDNVRAIFLTGQAQGRDPHAFSRLGDSTIENPPFSGPLRQWPL